MFDQSLMESPFFEDRHRDIARQIQQWCESDGAQREKWQDLPYREKSRYFYRELGQAGWLKHLVGEWQQASPKPSVDVRAICLIRQALAFHHDLADFAFAIQGLGAAPLVFYGSDHQRREYLDAFVEGRKIGAFAISEPDAGSNVADLQVTANKTSSGYVLNGMKTWVSNADIADYACVFARTGEGPGAMGISCFLVPLDIPGVKVSSIDLIAPRPFGSLEFTNCEISENALVGKAGRGFHYAMAILDLYRVSVGSAAIGFTLKAFQAANEWAKKRKVFDQSLADMQITKFKFADMQIFLDAAFLLVSRAAWSFDKGSKSLSRQAAIAKVFSTDNSQEMIDKALQLFGAAGVVKDSITEQLYRQIRSLRIYEGTSEIQKIVIAGSSTRSWTGIK